jgi:hypothetical protein
VTGTVSCMMHTSDRDKLPIGRHKEGKMNRKAIKECAEWLVYCLKIGWGKDQLDWLEAVWWKYHDENGNLK